MESDIQIGPLTAGLAGLDALEYDFETDRIYHLQRSGSASIYSVELIETSVDPPIYKDYTVSRTLGVNSDGFAALVDGKVAAVIVLSVEPWRLVAHIDDLTVGRRFRRQGLASMLIERAIAWARDKGCWAISVETQNVNYAAVQFYLRSGFEVWYVNEHLYPPGEFFEETAIILGRKISNGEISRTQDEEK